MKRIRDDRRNSARRDLQSARLAEQAGLNDLARNSVQSTALALAFAQLRSPGQTCRAAVSASPSR
eukprot:2969415-Pleurochrysis_carterae.AAC.1